MTVGGGVLRDGPSQIARLDFELQGRLFEFVGQPLDARLAVAVGADLKVGLSFAHEAIENGDMNLDVINRFVIGVKNGEVC